MPELPEVETIVRDLRPKLTGASVTSVDLRTPAVLRFPGPDRFAAGVAGATVVRLRRRGKFIHLHLDTEEDLVIHLGMSGTLTLGEPDQPLAPHTHLRLRLGGAGELRYRDPRRFGRVLLGRPGQLRRAGVLPELGPEPLSRTFLSSSLNRVLSASRRPVKAVLLDQAAVAGCGNIYADEACFLAAVRPDRPACELGAEERQRLLTSLPRVMRKAIRARGTSFSDYRDGFGARGEAYEGLLVYGRAGQPCPRCGEPLSGTRLAGRSTVFCRCCQL